MLLNKVRAENVMRSYGLEALIATSTANVFYTSDINPYGIAFVLLPYERNIEPAVIASISGPTPIALSTPSWIKDMHFYGEFYTTTHFASEPLTDSERDLIKIQESWEKEKEKDPISILIRLLKERGLTKGKIGVDQSKLPLEHPFWHHIKKEIGEAPKKADKSEIIKWIKN